MHSEKKEECIKKIEYNKYTHKKQEQNIKKEKKNTDSFHLICINVKVFSPELLLSWNLKLTLLLPFPSLVSLLFRPPSKD